MTTMKDSGIEWIGVISTDFNAVRIKYVFSIIGGCGFKEELQGFSNGKYPFYKASDLANSTTYISAANNYVDEGTVIQEQYKIIPRYSILLPKIGEAMKKNRRCINVTPCIVDNNCQGLVLNTNDNLQYLYYTLSCVDMIWFDNGGTVPCVNNLKLLNAYIPLPPLPEQQRIADYLDKQCSIMDKLAEILQQQIEKLREYKQSVITEAVTKGLDPNVAMKDSGIEWIGEIPAWWKIEKAKYTFAQRSERGNNISLQLLSPTQNFGVIPQVKYDALTGMKSVKLHEGIELHELKTIHKGDFCISLRSFQGGFEYSIYEGVVSPAYRVFYATKQIVEKYYKYLFKSVAFIQKICSYTTSFRDGKAISFEAFANSLIPLPPLPEQQRIANYLDKKCEEIDKLIKIKQEKIDKLSEYKKSLIYECVTGKREVAHE